MVSKKGLRLCIPCRAELPFKRGCISLNRRGRTSFGVLPDYTLLNKDISFFVKFIASELARGHDYMRIFSFLSRAVSPHLYVCRNQ